MSPFLRSAFCGILLFAFASLLSCSKDDASPENAANRLLVGRWELVETSGGLAGHTQPADPTQKQEIIFTAGGQVSFLLNNLTTSTSSYYLSQATAINGKNELFVNYSSASNFTKQYLQEASVFKMVLTDNMYDGFSYHFIRR